MFNKINKLINNKYSKFFRFIFFLRYLFAIFFVSIALFLFIPNFFNYDKKFQAIKNHIINEYNFEIVKYEQIKFSALPLPKIELINVLINLESQSVKSNVKNLKIYPKLFNIYNYDNFQTSKIIFKDKNTIVKYQDLKFLIRYFLEQKNRILLKNSKIEIYDEIKSIFVIDDIKFSNFGYSKNLIQGKIFGKKFKTNISDNLENINFKLIDTGLKIDINFTDQKKENLISGILKSKILNTNLKFNFNYDNKKINIYNLFFRSKNLSFKNEAIIVLNPFLKIKNKFNIEEINLKIFENIDIVKVIDSKNLLKKINSKNEIFYKSKKFNKNLIDELDLKIDFTYGRANYEKKFYIEENLFFCKGYINFLEEYPLLFFNCSISSESKKEFLKIFSVKSKEENGKYKANFNGNLSVLNKKISLESFEINERYKATKDDLRYFKDTFENILFDENFIKIFSLKKIKKFILEIS